jgi:DNA-binding CsgD family transcriptional regulator
MFLPEGIQALVGLGELPRAARLVDQLEGRGRELDRVWALATGARCRGLLLAASGDLAGSLAAFDRALREHERVDMPFERARTLLCLGTVQCRARKRAHARQTLGQAATEFDRLGARLWARCAHEALERAGAGRAAAPGELTQAERRAAQLAAAGHSNKEIAQALFVSVHTVEVHLSRIFAKLGIRSRAQLARRLPSDPGTR